MSNENQVSVPPIPSDGDSRDSSLIVYTITVTISIALFVLTLTISETNIYFQILNFISTAILAISTILTFLAIEYLVDITSFGKSESNQRDGIRKSKYLMVLRYYNLSVILIITAILLILVNYFLALCFKDSSCFENLYIDSAFCTLFLILWILVSAGSLAEEPEQG